MSTMCNLSPQFCGLISHNQSSPTTNLLIMTTQQVYFTRYVATSESRLSKHTKARLSVFMLSDLKLNDLHGPAECLRLTSASMLNRSSRVRSPAFRSQILNAVSSCHGSLFRRPSVVSSISEWMGGEQWTKASSPKRKPRPRSLLTPREGSKTTEVVIVIIIIIISIRTMSRPPGYGNYRPEVV